MLRAIAVLLLLIALFDVMVLVVLARGLGGVETVAIVVLTALVGLMLARFAGRQNLRRIERSLQAGELPTDHVLDSAMILVAGALLLTPGLVTDAAGLLFLFGPTRTPIRSLVKHRLIVPYLDARTGGFVTGEVYLGGFPDRAQGEPIHVESEVDDVDETPGDSKP